MGAFLRGVARLVDLTANARVRHTQYDGPAADARAMRRDWQRAIRRAARDVQSPQKT